MAIQFTIIRLKLEYGTYRLTMRQLKKLDKLIFATFGLYLKNLINYNIHRRSPKYF